jgi:hypothetical protein
LTFQPFNATFHLFALQIWHGNGPPCPQKKILIPSCLWISFPPRPPANAAPLAPWLPIAVALLRLGSAYPDESSIFSRHSRCFAPLRFAATLVKKGGCASVSLRPLRCRGQSTPFPSPAVPLPSRSAKSLRSQGAPPLLRLWPRQPVNGSPAVTRPARTADVVEP